MRPVGANNIEIKLKNRFRISPDLFLIYFEYSFYLVRVLRPHSPPVLNSLARVYRGLCNTHYMKTCVLGQFLLGTGRVPGWFPTPPLASCHRETNWAVLGPVLGQFGWQFWALPGRPGAAHEVQNCSKNYPKLRVCYKGHGRPNPWPTGVFSYLRLVTHF